MQPRILIFDEALSQLDSDATAKICEVILELKKEGKSILMVEHDYENLSSVDRIVSLGKDGLIEMKGMANADN